MKKMMKRGLALLLTLVMVFGMVPNFTVPAAAVPLDPTVAVDPGTTADWENIMGTSADGTRYAGRVWVDKSVYKDGDTVTLNYKNNAESTFTVDVNQASGEYFQVVFSALGSSMSTNTTVIGSRPMDVVLILDNSSSMNDTVSGNTTRMEAVVNAANSMLGNLLNGNDIRLGIVAYGRDAATVLPFGTYSNGVRLKGTNYTGSTSRDGIIRAYDNNNNLINDSYRSGGYANYTNTQSGIEMGMGMLASATNTANRKPIVIVLTDGAANTARDRMFVSGDNGTIRQVYHLSDIDPMIALSTLLGAAYNKALVKNHYGQSPKVYGIGVDLSATDGSNAIIDPAEHFNEDNVNDNIQEAYEIYKNTWLNGNVNRRSGGYTFRFEHTYPLDSGITNSDIEANINYVDQYYNVSGANLEDAFEDIYQELTTNAFNPITSTTTGATGVDETPLIYADNIGKYMEVKKIQALQVFDTTYPITNNGDGTYSVVASGGNNPTTGESWNANDIKIKLIEKDGTQQLRVYINQEILPILLDKITVKTENGTTTRTLEEISYSPLRLYYTVGIKESVLLPNGQVDLTKIDPDYAYIDNTNSTVSFYANAFGEHNIEDRDGDGLVELGDAHVGFIPSHNNRFYYHQTHQEIFISATNADGSDIQWENGEYGVLWDPSAYRLEAMSYDNYVSLADSAKVYTYITFNRPTGNGIEAEEVTYLIYANWGDLKESVTFFDKVNNVYLNGGSALDVNSAESFVNAYKQEKNIKDSDLIAIVGLQSNRVSRLHNMFVYKAEGKNYTQSAELAYAPAYNKGAHDDADIHEHSEVIVWLGNNGRLTLPIGTGLQVTKSVAELANGAAADEKFPISVLLDMTYSDAAVAGLTFADGQGNALTSSDYAVSESSGKILATFNLADGESAYILGLAGGVNYTVTESQHEKYIYTYIGANRTVTGAITAGVVTNQPIKPGTLYLTKEVVPYKASESFPTDYTFDIELTFKDKNNNLITNTEFQAENSTALSTDTNGVMSVSLKHGETIHILGIPAGATVNVEEVNLPGVYAATYKSRDHSGATQDNDGLVTISSQQNATVIVTNTYKPVSTSAKLDLTIEKTLFVKDMQGVVGDRRFDFEVEMWDGARWQPLETIGNVGFAHGDLQAGENKVESSPALIDLGDFTEAGTYIYQIYEKIPDERISGMAYDRTIHTITVTVTDNGGQLVATAVDEKGVSITDTDSDGDLDFTASFRNEENSVTVSIDIIKDVKDTSKNPEISKSGFEFVAQKAAMNSEGGWYVVPENEGGRSFSVHSDGVGEARLTDIYREPGTYRYIISEKPESKSGWNYSSAQYRVTVVVDNTSGDLTANMTIEAVNNSTNETATVTENTKGKIVFENKYDPTDAELPLSTMVKKKLTGRTLKAGEFTFAVFESGVAQFDANNNLTNIGAAIATGTNDEEGKVAFTSGKDDETKGITFKNGELNFAQIGKYEYDIIEVKGSLGGVTYDSIIYDLVVEVTDDDQNGELEIAYYFEDQVGTTVTFNNTYTVQNTAVVIDGLKTLQIQSGSKSLRAGDYTFYLYNESEEQIGETTNLANGTFRFAPITYTGKDINKTYTYTVKEKDAGTTANGVTYSTAEFTVTVKITDNGDGTLKTEVAGNGREHIKFVNTYNTKPVAVNLPATKKLEGNTLSAGQFKFALYRTDMNFENRVLIKDDITHNNLGEITLPLGTYGEGNYYFVVKEVIPEPYAPGIHYDIGEYQIVVNVVDTGRGQTAYNYTVMQNGNTKTGIAFNNIYHPEDQQLVLEGTKIYEGGKALADDMFQVALYKDTGEWLHTTSVKADGSFTFDALSFGYEDVGETFTYTVKEIIPDGATDNGNGTYTFGSNIYDATVYTVTVTVEDNGGVLKITDVVTNGGEIAELKFTNTFVPNPVQYALKATKTYEKGLKGDDFQFRLVSADNKTNVDQTKKNDANGDVKFDPITFSAAGDYKFTVAEKKDTIFSFIKPSEAEYEVTISVVNENGVLSVVNVLVENTKGTNESELNFINTYVMDGEDEVILKGTKILTGDRTAVKEGEFTFGLYDAEGKLVESVKNDASGSFAFSALKFTEKDVQIDGQTVVNYTVKEIAGVDPLMDYDDTVYKVAITIDDDDKGGIKVAYTIDGDANGKLVFTNVCTNPEDVIVNINIQKKVDNKSDKKIGLDGFTFVLECDSQKLTIVSNAEGKAGFQIPLGADDIGQTYTFKVYEKNGNAAGVTYDKTVYTVKIETQQNVNGSIKTLINDKEADTIVLEFTNIYEHLFNPGTGDNFPIVALGFLLVFSGAAIVLLILMKKKKKGGKYLA